MPGVSASSLSLIHLMRPFLRLFPALAVLLGLGMSPVARAAPRQPGRIGLSGEDAKMSELPTLVADYAKQHPDEPLELIGLGRAFFKDEAYQQDLMKQFEAIAPAELKGALASAGNMHNPKVNDLAKYLSKAFLQTQAAKELDKALKPLGRKVSKLSFEKFFLNRENGKIAFHAIACAEVGPLEAPEKK